MCTIIIVVIIGYGGGKCILIYRCTLVNVRRTVNAGVGEQGSSGVGPNGAGAKTTVFINDVAFEVPAGPFNVREAFGEEAVLIHSYGQPVLTNEWGVTLHSLQHGAFYYLVSSCP